MSKRRPGVQLTQDNWDQEDEETEAAGEFQRASDETLKQRKMKVAKRQGVSFQSKPEGPKAFQGFKGFSGFEVKDKVPSSISFESKPVTLSNGTTSAKPKVTTLVSNPDTTTSSDKHSSAEKSSKDEYLQQLKGLNECVTSWIKRHVDQNPYCILTPVFKDYEKHLAEIEKLNLSSSKNDGTPKPSDGQDDNKITSSGGFLSCKSSTVSEGAPIFKFSATSSSSSKDDQAKLQSKEFSFGTSSKPAEKEESKSSTSASSASGFSFGVSTTSTTSGFQFGTSDQSTTLKPFSFASGASSSSGAQDDDVYVPPKPDVTQVKEDDAIYSKRCKLFYQKDGEWVEKGIGTLYLKPLEDEKIQLLIRAETNLGNILLNILLNTSIQTKRQGKKDVSVFCIPSPPLDPKIDEKKPALLLLRVKTPEDADELWEKLEENKK